ncbi:uncharacterized protein LOC106167310 [Lingula anatina]|uniref:Uncharacterized protein LOC106167310 n=1 Tax=Lingula anatina TaxID=7574 RepID=A0A1S3ITI0_LINAN|nr:uncharacterized protein LOC106167310 [Lingula anatina]|eukprot:XP_013401507.1 uncharacterized protein LOC106167310 [Lingula anatina]
MKTFSVLVVLLAAVVACYTQCPDIDLSKDCYNLLIKYGVNPMCPYCREDRCPEKYSPVYEYDGCEVMCPSIWHFPRLDCGQRNCWDAQGSEGICRPDKCVKRKVLLLCNYSRELVVKEVCISHCCSCYAIKG